MRADYIDRATAYRLMRSMQPMNRLILRVALNTGLRIDDVCGIKREDLKQAMKNNNTLTIKEMKTGKIRSVKLRKDLVTALWAVTGAVYVFEHKYNPDRHRSRQAVWGDLHRVGRALRKKGINVSPHSLRKCFAVEQFDRTQDLDEVKDILNHDNPTTTMLYVMSREMTASKKKRRKKKYTPGA